MDKKIIILLLTVLGVIVALIGLTLGNILLPPPQNIPPPQPTESSRFFILLKTVVSFVNVALISFLLVAYIGMYRKMKTQFTLGLILVMVSFLLYALTSNPLLQMSFGFYAIALGPFAMIPDMFTTFALIVLIFITLE